MLGGAGQTHPAGLDIAAIGLAETGRGAHDAVFEDAADAVGGLVERIQFGGGEARRLGEDRPSKIGGDIGGGPIEPSQRVDHKAHLGERGGVGHRFLPRANQNSGRQSIAAVSPSPASLRSAPSPRERGEGLGAGPHR